MAIEIERKFLVVGDQWRKQSEGILYHQGYLNSHKERIVRIRTIGKKGLLTIKGLTKGASRVEYEYEIPHADAEFMLFELCEKPTIRKHRYMIEYSGFIWEVDEFHDENSGLILAEVELESENQAFEKPDWVGEEVTDDSRYFNNNLCLNPFSTWE